MHITPFYTEEDILIKASDIIESIYQTGRKHLMPLFYKEKISLKRVIDFLGMATLTQEGIDLGLCSTTIVEYKDEEMLYLNVINITPQNIIIPQSFHLANIIELNKEDDIISLSERLDSFELKIDRKNKR